MESHFTLLCTNPYKNKKPYKKEELGMNKKYVSFVILLSTLILLMSACGSKTVENTAGNNSSASTEDGKDAEVENEEILMIIDQTEKPVEGNRFDFTVKKLPKGYALHEMQWISDKSQVKNTLQQAIDHGNNGGDGFFIGGSGNFMGFVYPDEMKGEKGKAIFMFKNDQDKELSWQKEITLK